MVNEKGKNPSIPTPDGSRNSSSLDTIPHRGRKRSLSTSSISTKGFLNQQTAAKDEMDANRLLRKAAFIQKPPSSLRQSESARLLKLVPDLSQKEMSRLVGAIIKRQKRDAPSTARKTVPRRERPVACTETALFPEKSDGTHSQTSRVEMPARSAALTRQDAVRMLQESRSEADLTSRFGSQPEATAGPHRRDLAEELIHRATPRYKKERNGLFFAICSNYFINGLGNCLELYIITSCISY